MADGDKDARAGQRARLAGDDVLQLHAGDFLLRDVEHLGDDAVPDHLDLGMLQRAFLHDDAGAKRIAAMDEINLRGKAGQVGRLLQRGIAAADDDQRLVAELRQRAVAGRAVGDAVFLQRVLPNRRPEAARTGAGGDDDRLASRPGRRRR